MENKKQTAVEWLIEQVKKKEFITDIYSWHKEEIFKKALEMEQDHTLSILRKYKEL